jgi:hypothetical protein
MLLFDSTSIKICITLPLTGGIAPVPFNALTTTQSWTLRSFKRHAKPPVDYAPFNDSLTDTGTPNDSNSSFSAGAAAAVV